MESKLLTVAIPTYNMEKYLAKCLDSLIISDSSMMELLEVFVIIDGAQDKSSKIAHQYQDKYPNTFRVIDKENGNYGSCVNRGLKEAKGKYIKILDADDQFDINALINVLTKIRTLDVDLVLTNYVTIDDCEKITGTHSFNLVKNTISKATILSDMGRDMAMHAVIYKTENLRKINYHQTEGISYTDQEWIFSPMQTVNTFCYIDEYLYIYLVGREGQTMDIHALAKNMHHNLTVLKRNMVDLNELKNNLMYGYLMGRITAYMEYVYTMYLFNTDIIDVQPLIDFDKKLQYLNQELYSFTSTLMAGKLPFVKVWRLFYYRKDYGLNSFFAYRKYRMGIGIK